MPFILAALAETKIIDKRINKMGMAGLISPGLNTALGIYDHIKTARYRTTVTSELKTIDDNLTDIQNTLDEINNKLEEIDYHNTIGWPGIWEMLNEYDLSLIHI